MIRILDQVVAYWSPYTWEYDGELVEQVQIHLLNGMVLVMDLEEFLFLGEDESY